MTTDESAKCERCDDTGCPQCDPEWAQHQVRAPKADEDAINAKLAESAKREGAIERLRKDLADADAGNQYAWLVRSDDLREALSALEASNKALRELWNAREAHTALLINTKATREQFLASRDRLLAAWDALAPALVDGKEKS